MLKIRTLIGFGLLALASGLPQPPARPRPVTARMPDHE